MNHAVSLLLLLLVGSSCQWDLKVVNNLDRVVKQLKKLRVEVSVACTNLPAGAREVYGLYEYRLLVPNVDVVDLVQVNLEDLVLGVSVLSNGLRFVNVVRVLPAVVDVRQAYFTKQSNNLVVVVPYLENPRVVDVDCNVDATRTLVVDVPERNVWVEDLGVGDGVK